MIGVARGVTLSEAKSLKESREQGRIDEQALRCAKGDNPAAAAFFDVDGTIIKTTIVHYYVYYRLRALPRWWGRIWFPYFLAKCVAYLALDKFDRSLLNTIVYRNYAGLHVEEIKQAAGSCLQKIAHDRWLRGAREAIDEHRQAGRRIVLVTGSLDFLMTPLAEMIGGADILAASLQEHDGRFTGALVGVPVIAQEKATRMRAYAHQHALSLEHSHAYGDSSADLPMLEAVGFPHAVNPDRKLKAKAMERGWPVHDWPVEAQ